MTTRTTTLAYRYQLVVQRMSWYDAQRYCKNNYRASLVAVKNYQDHLALKRYLDILLGQLACRLIFGFY